MDAPENYMERDGYRAFIELKAPRTTQFFAVLEGILWALRFRETTSKIDCNGWTYGSIGLFGL